MLATTRIRCASGIVLAGFLGGGCFARMERPGAGRGGPPDPRATGPSAFESVAPAGSFAPPAGRPPAPPTVATERPAPIEPAETAVVVGSVLYALGFGGLQAVELSGEAGPRGRVALPGVPRALFVVGQTAYAVMGAQIRIPSCPACPVAVQEAAGSVVAAVDIADPRAPRLRARLPVAGDAVSAALEGSALHLVLRHGDGWSPAPAGSAGATLVSLDVTSPAAFAERGRIDVPAPTWVEEVRFAPGVAYLGVYGRQLWTGSGCRALGASQPPDGADGCTRLLAVDLQTMKAGASLEVRGRIFPGASDHQAGVLRALVVSSGAASPGNARFVTVSSRSAAEMTPLGTLALPGLPASDPTVTFAGARAYVTASDADNPLLIVDLAQPARPTLGGRLPAVGSIGDVVSASPGRLITAGLERASPPCAKREVAVFDVSNLATPTLLAREIGDSTGSPSGLAAGDDLVVLPFASPFAADPRESYQTPGVLLVDVDAARGALRGRGLIRVGAAVERTVRVGDRVLALSSQRAEVLDVRERDRPALAGGAQLSRTVSDLQPAGGPVVEVVRDWTFRPGHGPEERFHLFLASPDAPDAPAATPALSLDGQPGALFSDGRLVYLFRNARGSAGVQPRLEVLEAAAGATPGGQAGAATPGELRRRGSLSLAGPAEVVVEAVPDDERFARQVRQVAGTTFLVPLWRVRDCTPPVGPSPVAPPAGCTLAGSAPTLPRTREAPGFVGAPPVAWEPPPLPPVGAACPGADADFLVVDASKPDQPRIASRFRLEGDGELQVAIGRDRTVLITQRERSQRPDGSELVRHFVTEVVLEDVDRPRVLPRVNLPGALVAERPADGTWFAVEPLAVPRGRRGGLVVSALYHPPRSGQAYLQRQLTLPGAVSGPVTGGERLYFTADGELVTVDLRGPQAPFIVARTRVPGATTSGTPWEPPSFWSPPPTEPPGAPSIAADVHQLVAGILFVRLAGQTMVLYDARDPAGPRLLDRVLIAPGRSPIRPIPGDRAMIPGDEWGVQVLDLRALR